MQRQYATWAPESMAGMFMPHPVICILLGCIFAYGFFNLADVLPQIAKNTSTSSATSKFLTARILTEKKLRTSFRHRDKDKLKLEDTNARTRRKSSINLQKIISVRLGVDAKALLARSAPSKQMHHEQVVDRAVGWATLYWDIPTTTILPFMTHRGMARSTPSTLSSNRDYILSWHDSFLSQLAHFPSMDSCCNLVISSDNSMDLRGKINIFRH